MGFVGLHADKMEQSPHLSPRFRSIPLNADNPVLYWPSGMRNEGDRVFKECDQNETRRFINAEQDYWHIGDLTGLIRADGKRPCTRKSHRPVLRVIASREREADPSRSS
jgi:hypothetical protein